MVDAVSTANAIQTQAASSSASLTDNFDTFLSLLTAQLQNQDPLEPVDSTNFTNQLVQFSGVEQQIQTNQNIAELISITASSTAASLAGYLGRVVELDTNIVDLGSEGVEWLYDIPDEARSVTLAVQDAVGGRVVYSEDVDATSGEGRLQWNGETLSGEDLSSGRYGLVVRALDAEGNALDVPIRVRTEVTGVDLSSGTTAISTSSGIFSFDQVLRLAAAEAA